MDIDVYEAIAEREQENEYRLQVLEQLLIADMVLPFKRLHEDARLPFKSGELEACYDMTCVEDDSFRSFDCYMGLDHCVRENFKPLKPGQSHIFHTGVACAIPQGRVLFLWDRSGMGAKRNIHRLAGVIDCTYRGEIMVCLTNLSKDVQIIEAGDKIIQGHLALVLPGTPKWVVELPSSYRGEAGFGSTGK